MAFWAWSHKSMNTQSPMKGQLPLGLLVLNAGVTRDPAEIVAETIQHVRDRIGPVAAFKLCAVVDRLPKTRSGKILRGTMRSIADGQSWKMPATIDDPASLAIAERSRGTPRIANRLLRRVRDFAEVDGNGHIHLRGTGEPVQYAWYTFSHHFPFIP